MNKTELVEIVASKVESSKKAADAAVSAVFDAIAEALAKGEKVQLIGFGTFEVKSVAEKEGRNPQTGEAIKIPACKRPSFSAGKSLKDAVNK